MKQFDYSHLQLSSVFNNVIWFLCFGLTIFSATDAFAQISVNQATTTSQVEALVEDVLLGSCVTVSNVTYTGPASAAGTFNAAGTTFTM